MIARFILSYGHKGDDDFLAQVQATHKKQDEINKLPEPDKSKALKFMCDLGIIYSKEGPGSAVLS